MSRFVEGQNRSQVTLIPECLDDFIAEDNPVRFVDAFVQELDLTALGFKGTMSASTGRPSYDPAVFLKIYEGVETKRLAAAGPLPCRPYGAPDANCHSRPSRRCSVPSISARSTGLAMKSLAPASRQ